MALVNLQTNFRDPRFQRALLAERAARPFAALPTTGAATREFVGQDLDTRLAFARTGLESRLAMAQAGAERERIKLQRKSLRTQERMLPIQTGIGLITAGIGGLMGMREKRRIREREALESRRHSDLMGMMSQRLALLEGRV